MRGSYYICIDAFRNMGNEAKKMLVTTHHRDCEPISLILMMVIHDAT